MNPTTVRLYDINEGRIVTRFLDMCVTKGILIHSYIQHCALFNGNLNTDSASAASIFNAVFQENGVSWEHCIGVSVDNTSVNLGKRNSILTLVREKIPATYFMGVSLSHYAQHLYEGF